MSPTIKPESTNISLSVRAMVSLFALVITLTVSGVLWTVNLQYGIYKRLDRNITINEFLTWQRELGKSNPKLNVPNMAEHHYGNHAKEDENGIANAR